MATELTSNRAGKITWITVAGLCLALLAPALPPVLGWLAGYAAATESSVARLEWGIVVHWINLAALVALVIGLERQSLASIGVRPLRWWTIPFGLVAGAVIMVVSGIIIKTLNLASDVSFAGFLLAQSWLLRLAIVTTAGVFEETLYRGYALERLTSILGSKWLAGAITLVCFALAHIPAVGLDHLLPVFIVSLLVTLLYLWRRDLIVNMAAHWMVDAIALLIVAALPH